MNPTEIKKTLAELGGWATKRLGQHFLIDKNSLEAIVSTADIHSGETVLEIGPGLGVLTRALIDRGASVIAIEQDRRFAEYLRKQSVNIVEGDATKINLSTLVGQKPWKFVSNLPYNITSFALRQALWTSHPPEKVVVLIQREVAQRAIGKDGKTSLLSLMIALASREARIVKRVSPGAFYPPPKVESSVLEIIPMELKEREKRWGINPEKIMTLAKKGFAHPRKLLSSNLGLTDLTRFEKIGIKSKARAEDVSPEQWAELAKSLS